MSIQTIWCYNSPVNTIQWGKSVSHLFIIPYILSPLSGLRLNK